MLEVCLDSWKAAKIAIDAGADRVELCSVLDVGGVTPTVPMISKIKSLLPVPLIVLIRCRAGDFQYEPVELDWMLEEVSQAIDAGADGVAVGALGGPGKLNYEFLSKVVERASNSQRVVHRVFDEIEDPLLAIDQLCELGYHRILTSGGPVAAFDGLTPLKKLVDYADGRIEILPGGGVTVDNAKTIMEQTGCSQLHGSFRLGSFRLGNLPDAESIQRVKKFMQTFLHE